MSKQPRNLNAVFGRFRRRMLSTSTDAPVAAARRSSRPTRRNFASPPRPAAAVVDGPARDGCACGRS